MKFLKQNLVSFILHCKIIVHSKLKINYYSTNIIQKIISYSIMFKIRGIAKV